VLEQIEEALDLDSHVNPTRDVGELLSRALECYVTARKKDECSTRRASFPSQSAN
jgi:hypothetical protein